MSWEAEAITVRDSLKEAELSKGEDISNVIDKALAKFKSSDEFVALLKKDHDIGFDVKVEAIFYNIWEHYQDLDYAFLGGKLTSLIGEWIEKERLNAPDVVLPSAPPSPLTENVAEIKIVPTETSEQPFVVEVDKVTTTTNPSIAFKVPVSEPSSSVAIVQLLINLEEEPVATDAEEEPETAANPTAV